LRQTMVDSYNCLDPVVPERLSQVSKQSEVVYMNGAPSTPGYLLALLRELSHVPRGLTEIAEAKQVRKTNQSGICIISKKGSKSRSSRFEPKISLISFSRGSGPPLIHNNSGSHVLIFVMNARFRVCTTPPHILKLNLRPSTSIPLGPSPCPPL